MGINRRNKSEELLRLSSHLADDTIDAQYKNKLNNKGTDADMAYRIIKDQLMVEGNARLNLATFCQTYMEPQAVRIISETLDKNAIDKSLYTQTAEIEDRCVEIIADLWNRPDKPDEPESYIKAPVNSETPKPKGTSTIGSSEACMLGGLAMLERWKNWAATQPPDKVNRQKPNIIISAGYQVCWEKFEKYWGVELRKIPLSRDNLCMKRGDIEKAIDANTIGVVAVLGLTYTGMYDDVQELNEIVTEYNKDKPFKVYIHVDAASGGFYEPFIDYKEDKEYLWDFSVENVVSINASGHKYGLVYPGVGWIIWRNGKYLPQSLTFEVSYLGGSVRTVGINFSKSAGHIIAQYYNFIRLGFQGYKKIHTATRDVSKHISEKIADITVNIGGKETKVFDVLGEPEPGGKVLKEHIHRLPLVCWKLNDKLIKAKEENNINWELTDLSDRLLMRGWQVPSYPLPANLENVMIQRVVCRADLSLDLAETLVGDIRNAVAELTRHSFAITPVKCAEDRVMSAGFGAAKADGEAAEDKTLKPYGFTH